MSDQTLHDALILFQGRRNVTVIRVMHRKLPHHRERERTHMIGRAQIWYGSPERNAIFPVGTTRHVQKEIMMNAFKVGTMLRSADEVTNTIVYDEEEILLGVDAVVRAFDGVTALEALTLTFGYEAANVLALAPEEVSRAFEMVLGAGIQLPWSFITKCLSGDIDSSLVTSLVASHDRMFPGSHL